MSNTLVIEALIPDSDHRESYQQALQDGTFADRVASLRLLESREVDLEAAAMIVLAILQSDQVGLEQLLGKQPKIRTDSLCRIFLQTLAQAPNLEILAHLTTHFHLSQNTRFLLTVVRQWIQNGDLQIIKLITQCETALGRVWVSYGTDNLFQCAWDAYLGNPSRENSHYQILSMVLSAIPHRDTTNGYNYETGRLFRSIYSQVHYSQACAPLLWTLDHLLVALSRHQRPILLHRWALRDEQVVLGMMTRLQIDREQLIAWYDDHDSYLTTYQNTGWAKEIAPLPSKFDLDVDWINSLLSQKSARSIDR